MNISTEVPERNQSKNRKQNRPDADALKKLNDVDWMRDQYLEKGQSAYDLKEMLGVSYYYVDTALRKHGIPIRDTYEAVKKANRRNHIQINLVPDRGPKGPHWRWIDSQSDASVYIQQLLAIAKGEDPHLVFSPHSRVEFKDNRRDHLVTENIELRVYWWQNKEEMRIALKEHQTLGDIAEHWNTSIGVISNWMERHGLERKWNPETFEWNVVETGNGNSARTDA